MKLPQTLLTRQLARPSVPLLCQVLGMVWNRRNHALNDVAFTQVMSTTPDRVLEIGIGGGYLLQRLLTVNNISRPESIFGVDHSIAMVSLCRKRLRQDLFAHKLSLAIATVDAIPCRPKTFDCVVSVNSIFYWTEPQDAFSEIARILAPGGRLVLVFTCAEDLRNPALDRKALGLHDPEQIRNWLVAAGFFSLLIQQHQDPHRHFLSIQAENKKGE